MKILLRVLVFVLLVLSIVSLTLGHYLYGKRELLKGRTRQLEKAVVALGTAVEAQEPTAEQPRFVSRDISDVGPQILDTPELSDFWDRYDYELESQDQPIMNLQERTSELARLYKRDAAGNIVRDPATGLPIVEGPGTMQGVLDDLLTKAENQYTRLNRTRQQLTDLRKEYIDAVEDLNENKRELRVTMKERKELQEQIDPLKAQIAGLKQDVNALSEEKETLELRIRDKLNEIAGLTEQMTQQQSTISSLKRQLEDVMGRSATATAASRPNQGTGDDQAIPAEPAQRVDPGAKGRIAAVSKEWNFVVVDITDEFMNELMGEDPNGPVPELELLVKRPGEPSRFVTKIKLAQLVAHQKLAIADVLPNWQQQPVQEGDVVFF